MNKDEFYVGYFDKAPAGVAASMRKVVGALLASGVLLAVLLVVSQQPFYPSVFEFLQTRTFEGAISEQPYPTLRVERPGMAGGSPPTRATTSYMKGRSARRKSWQASTAGTCASRARSSTATRRR